MGVKRREKYERQWAKERTSAKSRRWQWAGVAGVAVVLVAAVWLIVEAIATRPLDPEERELVKPTVAEIVGEPEDYVRQDVKVSGVVEERLGEHAFVLEYDDEGLNEQIVVLDTQKDEAFAAEEDVIVTGRVVMAGDVPYDEELGVDYDLVSLGFDRERPMIVAETIRPRPGSQRY